MPAPKVKPAAPTPVHIGSNTASGRAITIDDAMQERYRLLSEIILEQMQLRGINQTELAERAQISRSSVQRALGRARPNKKRGDVDISPPGWIVVAAIADALGVPRENMLRICGLIEPLPVQVGEVREITHIYERLPAELQEQALDYMRYLYGRRAKLFAEPVL